MSGPFSVSDQKLQVGVVPADGRRLVSAEQLNFLYQEDALQPGTAILMHLGDRGQGPLAIHLDYWLTPLPPPGAVIVVLDGPDLGLVPTTVPIDRAAIAEAAQRATVPSRSRPQPTN